MGFIYMDVTRTGDFAYAIECKMCKYLRAHELDIMLDLYRGYGVVPVRAWPDKDNKIQLEYIMCPQELQMFKR